MRKLLFKNAEDRKFCVSKNLLILKLTMLLLCVNLVVYSTTGFAQSENTQQQIEISGTVKDANTGEPLPGVNIVIKGTTTGAISDLDGKFTLEVPGKDAVLVFSFIGYTNQEIVVGDQTVIDIFLGETVSELDEVIVVGYGTQVKQKVISAISTVNNEQLADRPIPNVQEGLMGAAAGLSIRYENGKPGSKPKIDIRGKSTIGDETDVLVLVDGIESSIADIDPNIIENISVLKDASASAIYGATAANGIILITTKKGTKSQKPQVNYRFNYGVESAPMVPQVVNGLDFMLMRNKALENFGILPEYSEEQLDMVRNGTLTDVDWEKELYSEPAEQYSHSLSINGGTEKTAYLFSLGYLQQDGLVTGFDDFRRINLRLKVETEINNWLTIGNNTALTNRKQTTVPIETGRNLRAVAFYPIKLDDGRYVSGQAGDNFNPFITSASGSYNEDDRDVMETQVTAKIKILKGLTFEEVIGYRNIQLQEEDWRNSIDYVNLNLGDNGYTDTVPIYAQSVDRSLKLKSTRTRRITTQSLLRYDYEISNHFVSGILGFESQEHIKTVLAAGRFDYLLESIQALGVGATNMGDNLNNDREDDGTFGNYSTGNEWTILSLFGRFNYDYMGKYLFEFNIRRDGVSRFGEGQKWGIFPSFSCGWDIGREGFIQNVGMIDMFKLRASWGQLGDAFKVDNYLFAQTVETNSGYYWPDGAQPGLDNDKAANSIITWETATMQNYGLDASLWNGKLGIQGEYFINNRTDILGEPAVPLEFGLKAPPQNVRDVKSWGWEISVSHKNKIGDIGYSLALNLADNNNMVTNLGNTFPEIGNNVIDSGYAVNSLYGYVADGLIVDSADLAEYTSTYSVRTKKLPDIGEIKLKDISGPDGVPDSIIDPNYDKKVFDDNLSHYIVGARLGIEYKGLSLTMVISGELKNNIYFSGDQVTMAFSGDVSAPYELHKLSFDPDNPDANAEMPILRTGLNTYDRSDYWLRKGGFVRMKNINLAYSLNSSILKRIKFIDGLTVYASIENAFLIWTNYFAADYGWDPELGSGAADYPLPRTISFGLNVKL